MEFTNFIYNWQQLIGAFSGALIAVLGSLLVNVILVYRKDVAERKKQYSNLLLSLQDMRRFISKCELYLESANKGIIPFDKILFNDKINYIDSSQVFDLKPEIYTSIEQIYSIINIISYNFKLSEVLEVHVEKKKNEDIHHQSNVISNKHWDTLNLIRYYLTDVYHKFNIILTGVKKLQRKYKYLKFSGDTNLYKKNYVIKNTNDFNLKNHYP
jgi:hypothetical protein